MQKYDKILYHFTSERHVNSCLVKGITKGVTFVDFSYGKFVMRKNTQWLTSNPDFFQMWNAMSSLPYDRTANRLTICIPQAFTENLHQWNVIGPEMAINTYDLLSMFGDPHNWYLYLGTIPPEWIVKVVKKRK